MSPKINDSLKVTSFTVLSWCCMLLLLAVCHCCLTTATYLCINLPNWSSTDGKEYGGLSWGCVNTLWPQYLSWNSGVLIFHLILILIFFFTHTFRSKNQHNRHLFRPSRQTELALRLSVVSVAPQQQTHTWHKWSVSTDVTETEIEF